MDDPLRDLEKRLERMVPKGLSEQTQERLEDQIDELAAQVGKPASFSWRHYAAMAAALASVAGLSFVAGQRESQAVAVDAPDGGGVLKGVPVEPDELADDRFKFVDYEFHVSDSASDGGYILSRFNEPRRTWSFDTREIELVLDEESGLEVRIVSERKVAVSTPVTSF